MSGFKLGDRVRLVDTASRDPRGPAVGAVGTVVDANKSVPIVAWDGYTYPYAEHLDDPTWMAVYARELEVVS